MKLYSLVRSTTFSTSGVAENTRSILKIPRYRNSPESCASKWLAGFPNAFFRHGRVAPEEAKVGKPREVSS